eukprot:gene6552-10558_t
MKFKFCGNLDAPEWLLNGISILSELTPVKLKLVAVSIMKDKTGETKFNYEKAISRTSRLESIAEQKAAIASLTFIILNAAKFEVKETSLSSELQQLGLPKVLDSSLTLCRSYKKYRDDLMYKLKTETLKLPRIDDLAWRVDFILSSSYLNEVNAPNVQLKIKTTKQENYAFDIPMDKFFALKKGKKKNEN